MRPTPMPLLLAALLLAVPGCASDGDRYAWEEGVLFLSAVQSSRFAVNLTDAAIDQFPRLRHLVDEWERIPRSPGISTLGPGQGSGMDYPYEEGVAIVRAIQAKEAWVNWPQENRVLISHEGRVYELVADRPHWN